MTIRIKNNTLNLPSKAQLYIKTLLKYENNMKKHALLFIGLLCFSALSFADKVINVQPNGINDIQQINQAIETAKTFSGEKVIVKLGGGTYNLHRNQAIVVKYFISNTMSWGSSPDNLKYIGIHLKSAKDITIDGEGAKLITHGEITSVIVDECENITLKNFTIDAADPTVTEMKVESVSGQVVTYKVHDDSNFQINGSTLKWVGEYGWTFNGGGVAPQVYDPKQDITWRGANPFSGVTAISNLGGKRVQITYNSVPGDVQVGRSFQMRDAVRDQVAGFIHKSKNVVYDHISLNFLGNFGVVCQYSDTLSFLNCRFGPNAASGRTVAGFADFLQVSGCKGLLKVEDSYFSGAHDDPINVHGTYLKIQNYVSSTQVKVKFMHHESWGFDAFFVGDSIEFVDVASMISIQSAKITAISRNDDQNITLSFDKPINISSFEAKSKGVVVENISWTPEVEIRRNYFSRVPTRGILLTTRRRSVIEDNTFFKMQMAGIYVSGDAASWYESGKVTDLTIRNNKFIECGNPVIYFDPTNTQNNGYVHSNITIDNNEFFIKTGNAVGGKSVNNLSFTNNTIIHTGNTPVDNYVSLNNSGTVIKTNNKKIQPGTVSLTNATTNASSSKPGNRHEEAIDEDTNTSWSAESSDTKKWWSIALNKPTNVNRIMLNFPINYVWKYIIEVSKDGTSWEPVINQSDNTTAVIFHSNYGNLGRGIQFIRVSFNSADASLANVVIFGGDDIPVKENLLSGTVIGTEGSWGNDPNSRREAVYDGNMNTFFDAPSGFGWAGLDLGGVHEYAIDSIRFAPRSGDYHLPRMKGGKFEIANNPNFSPSAQLFQITEIPAFQYYTVAINNQTGGRYVRYASPIDGFGNVSEVEFYGKAKVNSHIGSNTHDAFTLTVDRKNKNVYVHLKNYKTNNCLINVYSSMGTLIKQLSKTEENFEISLQDLASGCYIIQLLGDKSYQSKFIL